MNIKKIIVICSVFFAISVYAADKSSYYKTISEINKNKDYGRGIAELEEAIKEYPDEGNFYSNLVYWHLHLKENKKAYDLGSIAILKFPDNKHVVASYKRSLVQYGLELLKTEKNDEGLKIFKSAYEKYPDDPEVINGYGYACLKQKEYSQAIPVLEKGLSIAPDNKNIPINLYRSYFRLGEQILASGDKNLAYQYFNKAYKTGDKQNSNIYESYLYKLIKLESFDEAETILNQAVQSFGYKDNIYKAGFWVYYNISEKYADSKDYENMIIYIKKLYKYAGNKDLIYKDDTTFKKLAISKVNLAISKMISSICPYWKKFNNEQKELAYKMLNTLKKDLPSELECFYYNLYGAILYREDKVKEAHSMLEKAYNIIVASSIVPNCTETVSLPFPLKGTYSAGNYLSLISVTHMGFHRHCYDIYGCDAKGNRVKPGIKAKQSQLSDWYGFGQTVYSPVNGKVINAVSSNPDDNPFPSNRGEGNFIHILSDDGKLFNFFHLKKSSVLVQKDQRITVGQPIAQLGNSSSGTPHLHFGVYSKDWLVSYPVLFTNYYKVTAKGKVLVKAGQPGGIGGHEVIFN